MARVPPEAQAPPPVPPIPNRLVVRPATAADLGRVVELLALGAVPGRPQREEDPADLAPHVAALDEIEGSGGVVLVAQLGDEVVGVCQLVVFRHIQAGGGRCAELESVHVHPDRRRRGVGSALVLDAIGRARDLGCYRVQLTSDQERPAAHRFYERLGFRPSHLGFKLPLTPSAQPPPALDP
jgi:GNAT superfamily N-acetyltransferase